jgi:hypothetical protein
MGIQFNALEGAREFTPEDRRKVLKVLADVVHEIQDAHRLGGMFEPYAEIVHMVLTDDRIAQNFKDARVEEARGKHERWTPEEQGEYEDMWDSPH